MALLVTTHSCKVLIVLGGLCYRSLIPNLAYLPLLSTRIPVKTKVVGWDHLHLLLNWDPVKWQVMFPFFVHSIDYHDSLRSTSISLILQVKGITIRRLVSSVMIRTSLHPYSDVIGRISYETNGKSPKYQQSPFPC